MGLNVKNMVLWSYIRPPLAFVDKCANWMITLIRDGKPVFETVSARWGRERETNLAAQLGCPILDVIDPTTDNHCGQAAQNEAKND
jgi:hypothetical protein